jgi:hypothetical protein
MTSKPFERVKRFKLSSIALDLSGAIHSIAVRAIHRVAVVNLRGEFIKISFDRSASVRH